MRKKKGFTLVELLAVLVIIAVIILLISPQILKKINDSKDSLYETQMEEIKKSARVYMSNLKIDGTMSVSVGDLKKEGLVDKDIKDPRTGELLDDCILVTVTKVDENYIYLIDENTNSNCIRSEKYSLILVGNSTVEVIKGHNYVEDGVLLRGNLGNIIDPSDVDVTVSKNGSIIGESVKFNIFAKNPENYIDSSALAEYVITYKYVDGSDDSSVSRHVVIKNVSETDYTKPVFDVSPSGWSLYKNISVNFDQDGTYLLDSSVPITSSGNDIECSSSVKELYNCSGNSTTSLNPLTWYRINSADKFYSEQNGIFIAKITDGVKYNTSNLSITTIDRTPPTKPVVTTSLEADGKLRITFSSSDAESQIYGYQVSLDGGNNWKTIVRYPNSAVIYTDLNSGSYDIVVRAINNTYDGVTNGKTIINEYNSTLSDVKNVVIVANPEIKNVSSTTLSDRINLTYQMVSVTSFKIYYWENGKSESTASVLEESSMCTQTSCVISGLKSGQKYNIKITASNDQNNSNPSDDVEATPVTTSATTKSIASPQFKDLAPVSGSFVSVGSNKWTKENVKFAIKYDGTGINSPSYYFYVASHSTPTVDNITANKDVVFCGTGASPTSCSTNKSSGSILTTGWYKVSSDEVEIRYNREYEYQFKALTYDESNNVSLTSSATYSSIDKTAPVISNAYASGISNNSAVINIAATDNLTDRNIVGSGIKNYKVVYKTNDNSFAVNSSETTCTSSSCQLSGLSANSVYFYKVIVTDNVGLSTESETKSFNTTNVVCTPSWSCGTCSNGTRTCVDSRGCYANRTETCTVCTSNWVCGTCSNGQQTCSDSNGCTSTTTTQSCTSGGNSGGSGGSSLNCVVNVTDTYGNVTGTKDLGICTDTYGNQRCCPEQSSGGGSGDSGGGSDSESCSCSSWTEHHTDGTGQTICACTGGCTGMVAC